MGSSLFGDLRLAVRQLRRTPLFTGTAVLTLAIGMGVNTVAFGVVNALLFKPTSTTGRTDLGRIVTTPGGDEAGNASLPDFERFAERTRASLDLAAEGRSAVAWRHDGTTETAWVLFVSPNYFSMVNARVIAGRLAVERTATGGTAVVIGERFWREKLASASIAGLSLRLNNMDVGVAGVLPEAFTGPAGIYSPDVWLPLDELVRLGTSAKSRARDTRWLFLFGRLRPGATVAAVQGELDGAAALMAKDWPDTHKERGARFRMFGEHNSELRGIATGAAIGMSLIGLVLLLACFNVANLLLARGVERERDMGIRTALGAGPARLIRLVVTEGVVIAGLSGILALVIAWWTQSLVTSFAIPIEEPQHLDFTPDLTVVGYVAALVALAGVLPGLWPALAAARIDVLRVLGSQGANSASGRPSSLRRWLVGAQIAGSTAFLALAALLVQSFSWLSGVQMGFDRDRLVVAEIAPASNGYDGPAAARYVEALVARVRALPGVADTAVADRAPFFIGFKRLTRVWPDGGTCNGDACPAIATLSAGPRYFRAMGIALVAGREFEAERPAAEIVINQTFARQQWPDGRGLGETIRIGPQGAVFAVVGITAKHQTRGLDREEPTIYFPMRPEQYEGEVSVVVRTTGDPAPLIRSVLAAGQEIDQSVAMLSVKTMRDRMAVQLWPFRTVSWMFSICGLLSLALATVGLAGVIVHAVSRRLREFGVRVSLGATPRDLVIDVLATSARLLVPGLVTGVLGAAVTARLLRVAFFGVNVLNPATYVAVAALECAIVVVACLGPALRAARVDPVVALRG
jgi:putative ABC transport system permease protein